MAMTWKSIPGYEGWYSVSSCGHVRRDRSENNTFVGKILAQTNSRGYRLVILSKAGAKKVFSVHRLVCLAFHGPRPEGMQCNHINGCKEDNRVENLEYVTARQNILHAANLLGHWRGERNPAAKLTEEIVREIRNAYKPGLVSQQALADRYGVAQSTVGRILSGEKWRGA